MESSLECRELDESTSHCDLYEGREKARRRDPPILWTGGKNIMAWKIIFFSDRDPVFEMNAPVIPDREQLDQVIDFISRDQRRFVDYISFKRMKKERQRRR